MFLFSYFFLTFFLQDYDTWMGSRGIANMIGGEVQT